MNYAFLKLIGAWGKTAINPFVMMSGFFMCTSELTEKRFLKIFLQLIFYSWIIYVIFLLTDYESAAPLLHFALHAFRCVTLIMLICSLLDLAQQKWIERLYL